MSPVTLSRAFARLSAEGVLVTRPGSGTYVAERRPRTTEPANLSWQTLALGDRTVDATSVDFLLQPEAVGTVSLAGGYPHPSLLPNRALSSALARAARRPDASERPTLEGIPALRAWFARSLGAGIAPEDVLVTGGAQAALSAAFRAIAPAGAPVLLESPTYIGAIAVARAARLRAIPVPIDDDGAARSSRRDTSSRVRRSSSTLIARCDRTVRPTNHIAATNGTRTAMSGVLSIGSANGCAAVTTRAKAPPERPARPPVWTPTENPTSIRAGSTTPHCTTSGVNRLPSKAPTATPPSASNGERVRQSTAIATIVKVAPLLGLPLLTAIKTASTSSPVAGSRSPMATLLR